MTTRWSAPYNIPGSEHSMMGSFDGRFRVGTSETPYAHWCAFPESANVLTVSEAVRWCRDLWGDQFNDYPGRLHWATWRQHGNTFEFKRPEDAFVFKMRFG